jgi:hypothetical protein
VNSVAAIASKLDVAAAAMLTTLGKYLPAGVAGLPVSTVALASMAEQSVGIGRIRGSDAAGPFGAISLKAVRLDALAHFQLWAQDLAKSDRGIGDLNMRLMADRETLRAAGLLRFSLEKTGLSEFLPEPIGAWRAGADYRVLYEFDFQDGDDAQGLIASIPVSIDSGLAQSMTISDEMMRWDNKAAPPLLVRGPGSIGCLSLLVFVPGPPPTGAVSLTRTFDGAGNPKNFATLSAFFKATSGSSPPERNATISLASFTEFRNAFTNLGDPIAMGDLDSNGVADLYKPLALRIDPAIQLARTSDRFEVAYKGVKFNQLAAAYLRATV